MYRVHDSTEGAFAHYPWHNIYIANWPYFKICQMCVGEARSAVPFLARLKTTSKTHSLARMVTLWATLNIRPLAFVTVIIS